MPGIRETWEELLPMLKGVCLALPLAILVCALLVLAVLPWVWPNLAYGCSWWIVNGWPFCF